MDGSDDSALDRVSDHQTLNLQFRGSPLLFGSLRPIGTTLCHIYLNNLPRNGRPPSGNPLPATSGFTGNPSPQPRNNDDSNDSI